MIERRQLPELAKIIAETANNSGLFVAKKRAPFHNYNYLELIVARIKHAENVE
mgnify:CR=1 FL=1